MKVSISVTAQATGTAPYVYMSWLQSIYSSNLDDVYFGVVVGKTNVQLNNCFVMLNNINYELCDLYRTSKPIT